ncbi:metalloendopeptidase [Elysia marginata]|uniref:Metalloendopeptidase n=1 Tax=Elysia marginata TaxID=1093978 RepID=A0AAV4GKR6_9GAST|nr:metalloendopeptidase [Elysia marginata]
MEITLDKVESSITLTTPGYWSKREPNRRCFYNFLVPDGARVKITFNTVDMEAEDKMYVRRFHKWQEPHPIDRKLHPYQIVSEKSYLALEWWSSFVTHDVKHKGVNFTASVILAEDSCYNLTSRGADYAGDHTYSETFEECLPWDQTTDCTDFPSDSPDTFWLLSSGNKCRNPDGHLSQPWCYTYKNGTNCHKRYCDVCNHLAPVDVIKNCSALISAQPDFCSSSISRFGCFKSCNMTQPVYKPVTCGPPPVPSDGELVGSAARSTYRQGDHAFVKCLNPRDPMMNSIKCTAAGWTNLSHACSASYDKQCPDGWTHHGARCFRYFISWATRRQAESNCQAMADSGTLFQIRDVHDQVMMRRFRFSEGVRGNYVHGMWISGELSTADKRWYFTGTTDEMKYFNWTQAAVTNDGRRNCIKMTAEYSWAQDAGAWKTLACDDAKAVAPYVCQIDILGAEVMDRSELCQGILTRSPYFCSSTGTRYVAHQYCSKSCDGDNGTLTCHDPQVSGYSRTSDSPSVGSGEVMTFACPKGQQLVQGDLVRACGMNGTWLGEEPVCSGNPSSMTVKVDSLRKRPQRIKANCVYMLDTDAYRVPMKGRITGWFYVCTHDGDLHVSVFKRNGRSRYKHVGTNSFSCEAGYKREYRVPLANQIAADAGDVIAVMSSSHYTLSANGCDDAMYEVMLNPYAWVKDKTFIAQASVFANTTCMVPSLGGEGEMEEKEEEEEDEEEEEEEEEEEQEEQEEEEEEGGGGGGGIRRTGRKKRRRKNRRKRRII